MIAVVGGGITGLAAAWELARSPGAPAVVVLESSGRFGGRIETVRFAGLPVDAGPDAFVTRSPAAEELCREVGLGDDLIAPASAAATLYVRGSLRPLPKGLVLGVPTDRRALRRSGLLSLRGRLRVAADLVLPRTTAGDDPSVAAVVGARVGPEALAVLVEPIIGGINAGTVDRLSLRSVAPQVAAAARAHRSLIRGLRMSAAPPMGADGPRPVFLGLAGGLGTLVDRLVEQLGAAGVELATERAVTGLRATGGGYALEMAGGATRDVDGIVVALPAPAAAPLFGDLAPAVASDLGSIAYASVALVTLAWPATAAPAGTLAGSGFLVPRASGHLLTACTFTSVKWPRSTVPGRIVVRASVGRAEDERGSQLTDGELVVRVREELAAILGITQQPLDILLRRFPGAFPQYEPGHEARAARIRAALEAQAAVTVAGAALDGIGIPACIASGRKAATDVLAALAATRHTTEPATP